MRFLTCACVLIVSVLFASQQAHAVPITLDFPSSGGSSPAVLGDYQVAAPASSFIPNGLGGLFVADAGALTILSRLDGGAFNFDSITFRHGDPNVNVVFTGLLPGGGMVNHAFNDNTSGTDVALLPASFDGVVSVSWNQGVAGNNAYAFDLLVVEAVAMPEPASLGLMTLAAAGLLARRRRVA